MSGKPMGSQIKQASSMGAQEFVFPAQLDYGQPIVSRVCVPLACYKGVWNLTILFSFQAHIPFQYAEPYFGGLLAAAAYGPQAMVSALV